eukprot:TRINITY_DN1485_c0_g8_i1.p1 TRINITY_DN1485_c0_g8~~TRINITY_DN1485_c0_g8_i1.p1  ORF type:complete len:631 (+),score=117.57 TRINITY_DN1485_c0_g8_i1:190-2082(+)
MPSAEQDEHRLPPVPLSARRPSNASATSSQQDRRKARSASTKQSQREHENVKAMVDEELNLLKEKLEQHRRKQLECKEEQKVARKEELELKIQLNQKRQTRAQKRLELLKVFQRAVRTVMMRRRILGAISDDYLEQLAVAPQLPQKLQNILKDLQHSIHKMQYTPEDQHNGAARIQARWRGILCRRAVRIMRIAWRVWQVKNVMDKAATKLQRWLISRRIRNYYKVLIQARLEQRRIEEQELLAQQVAVTIKLQSAIRARLARKRQQEAKAMRQINKQVEASLRAAFEEDEHPKQKSVLLDTWRPRSEGTDWLEDVRNQLPPRDRELEKIEEEGLVPFYWSASTAGIRHRIGGPMALRIQRQIGMGQDSLLDDATDQFARQESTESVLSKGDSEVIITFTEQDDPSHEEGILGGNWNVYPEGLSQVFLKSLKKDEAWKKKSQKEVGKSPKPKKKASRKRERGRKTTPTDPPPNLRTRADEREAIEAEKQASIQKSLAGQVVQLSHPLLEGMIPPNVPFPQPVAPPGPPKGRPRPQAEHLRDTFASSGTSRSGGRSQGTSAYRSFGHSFKQDADDDCSWGDATGFYTGGNRPGRVKGFDEPLRFASPLRKTRQRDPFETTDEMLLNHEWSL